MSSIGNAVLERFLSSNSRTKDTHKVELVNSMLLSCNVDGYSSCCAAIRDMDLSGQLALINNPTLVIAGELDPATPVSHSELIVEGINGAKLTVIPGVAHLANLEKPDEFKITTYRKIMWVRVLTVVTNTVVKIASTGNPGGSLTILV